MSKPNILRRPNANYRAFPVSLSADIYADNMGRDDELREQFEKAVIDQFNDLQPEKLEDPEYAGDSMANADDDLYRMFWCSCCSMYKKIKFKERNHQATAPDLADEFFASAFETAINKRLIKQISAELAEAAKNNQLGDAA